LLETEVGFFSTPEGRGVSRDVKSMFFPLNMSQRDPNCRSRPFFFPLSPSSLKGGHSFPSHAGFGLQSEELSFHSSAGGSYKRILRPPPPPAWPGPSRLWHHLPFYDVPVPPYGGWGWVFGGGLRPPPHVTEKGS